MLDRIKSLLRIDEMDDSEDAILEELILLAQEEALSYVGGKVYNSVLDSAVVLMVAENYRRLGTEGLASQSYSSVSESFIDTYSHRVITMLNRYKVVRVL